MQHARQQVLAVRPDQPPLAFSRILCPVACSSVSRRDLNSLARGFWQAIDRGQGVSQPGSDRSRKCRSLGCFALFYVDRPIGTRIPDQAAWKSAVVNQMLRILPVRAWLDMTKDTPSCKYRTYPV
jgi:hypothetical protein